ncbi:MAG TPA: hypothetical protein VKA88_04400 [Solirubrobacterales bacterium]|nr:hypothetical protein [Solirubrobacterales bacterium]
MTTMLETEAPDQPDEVGPPRPEEDDAERDRPPAPDGPVPAEAPEVPAGEPKEG